MKILAFGEAMLRFTVPEYMLLEQSDMVRMTSVGTGVNLLASLAHFGYETELVTALPKNPVGRKMAADIRKMGISDQKIIYNGNHIGSFFVELGYGSRPERVTYQDRLSSAFCRTNYQQYQFEKVIKSIDIVHICGISLSLTKESRNSAIELARLAHQSGKKVCFDFNYRIELNKNNDHQKMKAYYQEILQYVDIVFGSLRDLTDLLDYKGKSEQANINQFIQNYHIQYFAGTKRIERNGKKYFTSFITQGENYYKSKEFPLYILDRIGSGDAFASGVIAGIIENYSCQDILEFATINSILAQSSMNDAPLFTKQDIQQYIASNGNAELVR